MARAVVPIRLDTDEQDLIDKAAARLRIPRARYIRQAALTAASLPVAEQRRQRAIPSIDCSHGIVSCRICGTGRWAR